jgi:hypothetical protein
MEPPRDPKEPIVELRDLQPDLKELTTILDEFGDDLSEDIAVPDMRGRIFDALVALQKLVANVHQDKPTRRSMFRWYKSYIWNHKDWLRFRYIDPVEYPYMNQLRFQVWTNLYESAIVETDVQKLVNVRSVRAQIANIIGFGRTNILRKILVHHKRLFVENASTSKEQRANVYRLMSLLPMDIIYTEAIRIRGFLGMDTHRDIRFAKRSGVNIFTTVGLSVVMHELNHTLDKGISFGNTDLPTDTVHGWTLAERARWLLYRAAGPDVKSANNSFDKAATQQTFLEQGFWDGVEANWDYAWLKYWGEGPGIERNLGWLRQAGRGPKRGIPFFIGAPQEILAGFSNIYVDDTEALLNVAVEKFHEGHTEAINQILMFVDIYSEGKDISRFYRASDENYVDMILVDLTRDSNGFITSIETETATYTFVIQHISGIVLECAVEKFDDVIEAAVLKVIVDENDVMEEYAE